MAHIDCMCRSLALIVVIVLAVGAYFIVEDTLNSMDESNPKGDFIQTDKGNQTLPDSIVLASSIKQRTDSTVPSTTTTPTSTEVLSDISTQTTTTTTTTPKPEETTRYINQSTSQDSYENTQLVAWERFKLKYRKTYSDQEEELRRRKIFEENINYIAKFNEGDNLYKLAMNKFGDMSLEERNSMINGVKKSWDRFKDLKPGKLISVQQMSDLEQVDWRSSLNEIVDQGQCRDSSLFAAITNTESLFFKETSNNNNAERKRLNLSHALNSLVNKNSTPVICAGNLSMMDAFDVLTGKTIVSEGDKKPLVSVTGYTVIHPDNLIEALSTSGPLTVAIDASLPSFHFYGSGLYYSDECSTETFNHHALVVGFYPEKSIYGGKRTEAPFYVLRHSLGSGWGESGEMRMLKVDKVNKCLPQVMATQPIITLVA